MAEVEEEVFASICELNVEQLVRIYDELGLPNLERGKRVKSYVLKTILKYLSSDELEQSDDSGNSKFLWIQSFINGEFPKKEDDAHVIPEIKEKVIPKIEKNETLVNELLNIDKVLKKDFKIKGSIGLPGQKDKLTFSSLAYQINIGEKKKYSDVEICEEVIRAISPDLPLRCFLESKTDLNLANLRKILRAHFQEKDPTTLFNQLSNSSQQNSESPLDFVIRLMNLRQKVLFVSKEMDTRFQYTESLVQNQFLHSVVTGLRNDNIRNEVKPSMVNSVLSDEELLEFLNKAVSDENERQHKMKKTVNKIDSIPKEDTSSKKSNPILDELRELKVQISEITSLKHEIADLKKQINQKGEFGKGNRTRFQRFGCANCKRDNVFRCTHCFLCGASDHVRAACPNSEN